MITDRAGTIALQALSERSGNTLWRFDNQTSRVDHLHLDGNPHLQLHAGDGEFFAAVETQYELGFRVTARPFSDPRLVVSAIVVTGPEPAVTGEHEVWSTLPSTYFGSVPDESGKHALHLLSLAGSHPSLQRVDLGWFENGPYDHGWQAPISVVKVGNELLFGVQRSSELVLFDPQQQQIIRRIPLADRGGNPQPVLSMTTPKVWVVDYDTLVSLDRESWSVDRTELLQPPTSRSRMFVGRLWTPHDQSFLLVPRPGSGDVLVIDPDDFTVTEVVTLGGEPLEAVVLSDGVVIAREWKTGNLMRGQARFA